MNGEETIKDESIFNAQGGSGLAEEERAEDDYYATNPKAVDDLLRNETFGDRVWECACGEGHISKRLQKHGKNIYSTDKVDRGYGDDFFDFIDDNPYDRLEGHDIITNPPFSSAKHFVEKSYDLIEEGRKIAMFLRISFLESVNRLSLFERHPPIRVYVYSSRICCAKNGDPKEFEGSGAMCFAWFVWKKGNTENPMLSWIKPESYREQTKLEGLQE